MDKLGGDDQEVTITVLDGGPRAPGGRYHCYALAGDGRFATGNHDDSLDAALALVHWHELDGPRYDKEA